MLDALEAMPESQARAYARFLLGGLHVSCDFTRNGPPATWMASWMHRRRDLSAPGKAAASAPPLADERSRWFVLPPPAVYENASSSGCPSQKNSERWFDADTE